MLSPQPEAEKGTGENVDSGAPGVTDAPHPADDPLEVIRKGPTEVFQFIEESFGQLEAKLRHNNEVLQSQAQETMKRVESLEQTLQAMLKEISSYSQDPLVSDDIQAKSPSTVDQ